MIKTWSEVAREEGRVEGQRTMLKVQLESKFGSLRPAVFQRLEELSPDELAALAMAVLQARSLQELGLEN